MGDSIMARGRTASVKLSANQARTLINTVNAAMANKQVAKDLSADDLTDHPSGLSYVHADEIASLVETMEEQVERIETPAAPAADGADGTDGADGATDAG
jgi:hypothetical protein